MADGKSLMYFRKTFGKCFYMNIKILLFKICHSAERPGRQLKSLLKKSFLIKRGKSDGEYLTTTSLILKTACFFQNMNRGNNIEM